MLQTVHNILRVYHQACAGEIDAGLRWYSQAHDEAKRIQPARGNISLSQVCAIIAVLSPGLRWERNLAAADRVIRGEGLEGLGIRWYRGVRKAEQILNGEAIADVLQGNKTFCFYDNLFNPSRSERVTIDGHAWAIQAGIRLTLDKIPSLSDKQYRRIEEDYQTAAGEVSIRPLQLQAITWCVWRRIHGVNSAHYLPLFEE
jgi:hypothetical protein